MHPPPDCLFPNTHLLLQRKLREQGVDVVLVARQRALGAPLRLLRVARRLALRLDGADVCGALALLVLGLLAL